MKKIFACCSAFALLLGACSDNDETVASQAVAPAVESATLADGAVDVETTLGAISLYTSAPLRVADEEALTLTAGDGTPVELTASVANKNLHLAFGELANNTVYTLSIPAGTLENAYDASLTNAAYSLSFTTVYSLPDEVNVVPAENLTDAEATAEAKALYAYIRNDLFLGGKVAVGTMSNYRFEMTEAEWVAAQTGKKPWLHCFDLIDLTGSNPQDYAAMQSNAAEWHAGGGVVAAMWHWRDPSKKSSSFRPTPDEYGQQALFDLSEIVAGKNADGTYAYATDSEEYKNILEDIAAAKAELQKLADAGIPVLWRPLHEASGAWFWWGAQGPDASKALWQLLRREMADLHNLIWVWTVQTSGSFGAELQWYPGDDAVDIVGVDVYEETHGSFAEAFKFAAEVSGSKKAIALTECGAMPDPAKMAAEKAPWAYCMPWYGDHTQSDTYNGAAWWTKMIGDQRVVAR